MRTPVETVDAFVAAFHDAWAASDPEVLSPLFSEDASYHNGPLPPAHGREGVLAAIAQMMTLGGDIGMDIVHRVTEGPVVITERVDSWSSEGATATLRIAGVFEVHDGRITAWREYFDLNEFLAQTSL
jgi:limonene-1,2-epoxide hydrolase